MLLNANLILFILLYNSNNADLFECVETFRMIVFSKNDLDLQKTVQYTYLRVRNF